MGKRRAVGDRVWLADGAGFGGPGVWATIMPGEDVHEGKSLGPWNPVQGDGTSEDYCWRDEGIGFPDHDPECREWPNIQTEDGHFRYHVAECEMYDAPEVNKDRPQEGAQDA